MGKPIDLTDKYTATEGRVFITGTQALVRLPMVQMRRDRAAGLNTGTYITGYRGSPVGGYDQQILAAQKYLSPLDIHFQPGVNEELAATAIWGTQQVQMSEGARKDGVLGIWYGKGPGVDRSGDAFKHANAAGTSPHGGVLAIAGDDHTCKSSTVPHQSDHGFAAAVIPMLYPSSVHEFIEMGLFGIAMSRFSGCWTGFKVISETIETTTVIDLAQEQRQFVIPEFEMPAGGLHIRWPDPPMVQDERLQEQKAYAALAFARANGVDMTTIPSRQARFGIVASGKAYEDVLQALDELGISKTEANKIGLTVYKVRMPWPLEPEGVRGFSKGLCEILVVEERREIIETQIKSHIYNWQAKARPRIVGKFDEHDRPLLPHSAGLTVGLVARTIAERLLAFDLPEPIRKRIAARQKWLAADYQSGQDYAPPVQRVPHFCAGCPHNSSTKVPEGSKAMAGIGCHYMVHWMDRETETFTQMGAEGAPWCGIHNFTNEAHRFVNLGDGTYFHSGIMAIRQAVASGANITYKLLYNDAVAMTGGQPIDGDLSPQRLCHQLAAEGVSDIHLVTNHPDEYRASDMSSGVVIKHRDDLDAVQKHLRERPGCTAIVYVQTCAAELRRRRKKGLIAEPEAWIYINPAVCEGCGDCSVQSNCIAIEPLETEFGRKRQINQSMCNKDYSCLKGFCSSFVTVTGTELQKPQGLGAPDISKLPDPRGAQINGAYNIAVTGVGGTGVLTIGALLAMAAHIDGLAPLSMDISGLAQKGGAVLSHIRIGTVDAPVRAPRITRGRADLLIAADGVVAASPDGIMLCNATRTHAILNAKLSPVSDFTFNRDFDFKEAQVEKTIAAATKKESDIRNFSKIALGLLGDEIFVNVMMLGFAYQKGLLPVSAQALHDAIALNGVAIAQNKAAFDWGRAFANDARAVLDRLTPQDAPKPVDALSLDEIIQSRKAHLAAYQNQALADRYAVVLEKTEMLPEEDRRTIALNYAKLLSYKDEYEVARLYQSAEFKSGLAQTFQGTPKLSVHLAPPMLADKTSEGRLKKRPFGPWVFGAFSLLAKLKSLRGTLFDPFGYTKERRAERQLIQDYEADIERVLNRTTPLLPKQQTQLLGLPGDIRGFGPVKMNAISVYYQKRGALLENSPQQQVPKIAAE
ncbi:MAG: indolepyruvate ferredoxin oxidoreductase family protein [Pseudomonadota bacterium]